MDRRRFLMGGAGVLTLGLAACGVRAEDGDFPVSMSEREWRDRLTPDAFAVLRQEATERPFTSPLLHVKETGDFLCAGCDNPLYSSATKYDSGTGWPSFYAAMEGSVGTKTDYVLIYPRTEVHCAQCGGHLGHVFDDGPPPTGKRHCINGVSLRFEVEAT